jgi:flagellar motor switch/type III secretory pathway protein FliN
LDLLLDVELPVILSFGRARLSLKDVIQLTTGSGEISS